MLKLIALEDPLALQKHVEAWQCLARNATEPNPFYKPWLLLPAIEPSSATSSPVRAHLRRHSRQSLSALRVLSADALLPLPGASRSLPTDMETSTLLPVYTSVAAPLRQTMPRPIP